VPTPHFGSSEYGVAQSPALSPRLETPERGWQTLMYAHKGRAVSVAEEKHREEVERRHALRRRFGLFLGRMAMDLGVRRAA